jgi:kynurenine formamidase
LHVANYYFCANQSNIMKNSTRLLLIASSLLFIISCGKKEEKHIEKRIIIKENNWIDLTYTFDSTTLYWPNNVCGFEHKEDFKGTTPGGYFYSSYSICTPEHGGTHIDAPIHFAKDHLTVDSIPLSSLSGRGIIVDVSEKALKNRDYQVTVADLQAWEKANGEIKTGTIILFRTGYGQFYPNREKYFGSALTGEKAIPELHFPGISAEAATWLVKTKKAKAVGLDTPSMDYGQSKDFMTHRILLGANIPGFENVAHLDQLPLKGFEIMALPMKIGGGSGAPLRIAASVMEMEDLK